MKRNSYLLLFFILFIFLTLITQIGGIALMVGVFISNFLSFRFKKLICPIAIYLIATFCVVPFIASIFGREKITNSKLIKPTNYFTVLLNRNYVKPELNKLLQHTSEKLSNGVQIRSLDANFPFYDKFLLLPHLSHNDGRKIDISFVYKDGKGKVTNNKPSRSGYGVFENPLHNEFNQTNICKSKGYWQYDLTKYLTFGNPNKDLSLSLSETKRLIKSLLSNKSLSKMFLEKHLINRMKLKDSRIRFLGCQAVRHDDHIHIQIK